MKKVMTIIAILVSSSTVFASNCPKADALRAEQVAVDQEAKKVSVIYEYVKSRVMEEDGVYSNSIDLLAIMTELGSQSLDLAIKSGRLSIAISQEVISCTGL